MAKKNNTTKEMNQNEGRKTLAEIAEELTTVSDNTLHDIIGDNENIMIETLTDSEKFCVLVFRELAKSINREDRTLVFDANYPKSKFAHKTEKELAKGQTPQWLVNRYRLLNADGDSIIQVKTKRINTKTGEITFDINTSCAKLNREQFAVMEDELYFKVEYRKTGEARNTAKDDISYDGLTTIVDTVCAVFANSANAREEVRRIKAEQKAEAKRKAEEAKQKAKEEKEAVAV